MAFSNIDRTVEVENLCQEIAVNSTDYCRNFIRHPDTFLQRRECWTCRFSDFGIETGSPKDIGICQYHTQKKGNNKFIMNNKQGYLYL